MTQYDNLAEFYDYEWTELTNDIEFVKELAVSSGGPVLEFACGTGRLMFPIAQSGIEIFGIDNSSEMIKIGRERLKEMPEEIQKKCIFDLQDMTEFDLKRKFRFVFIPFNSFLLLTDRSAHEKCLKMMYDHMEDDGTGLIDVFSPNFGLCAQQKSDIRFLRHFPVPENRQIVIQWEYVERDMAKQVMEIDFLYEIYDKNGSMQRKTSHLSMSLMFRYELQYLIEKAGFEITGFYGNYDRSAFAAGSPQLIYTFKKHK